MHRIDAAGFAVGNLFTDGNPSTGTPATVVDAAWLNDQQENVAQLVEAAGIVLSKGDYTQLLKAIVTKGMQGCYFNIGTAAGTADAITSSYTSAIAALTNGMTLYVRASAANATTTPTFTPNNGVIPAKTIVKGAGAALAAGDIAGAGHWIELQYDAALDKWVLANPATGISVTTVPDASTAVKGKVQLATAAEAKAGTDALKVLTPATLAATLSAKTSTFYTASCAVGTVFAITHGMGAVAAMRSITYGIECVTAELGYSAGDRVFTQSNDGSRSFGFNIDDTTARFLTNGSSVGIYNKATASSANNAITPAKWRFFLIISV